MNAPMRYSPGQLVTARGREWVVLPGSDSDRLNLRPLSGSENEVETLLPEVELDPVETASFPAPDGSRIGPQDEALLLRDAFRLALRRGAGPFRGAGRVAFEPKAYQIVPLMMALKLDVVRLLIADDVGIGKTIEAGLIARELLDRGEIERMTVLCPPHLVDQWVKQLSSKFLIPAVAVTAASASRLEASIPRSENLFRVFPFTVVSLDYIKSDIRRDAFIAACPEFVIVDEAHTCVAVDDRTHRRYQLLESLAKDASRNMVLLTATPHSGIVDSFHKLLGLLDPDFRNLGALAGPAHDDLRRRLALHFVQRRRVDIEEWKDGGVFPKREEAEQTYKLTGEHQKFLESALDYCTAVVEKVGADERKQRLAFWGTLALMRCVGSSPAAALRALNSRAKGAEIDFEALFDGRDDAFGADDSEPAALEGDGDLTDLIDRAKRLLTQPDGDPKLSALKSRLKPLIREGFSPVVFCRYISTAEWVGRALRGAFKVPVEVVHGELPADERRARIEAMDDGEQKILVATDCLSEGIDLQEIFDSVVHYDLCWNPTRHQQRNGRVDRFGQLRPVVRSLLIWGENNPVDGAVLQVILRKAAAIQKDTGVPVPLPDDDRKMTEALLKALLLRRKDVRAGKGAQGELDLGALPEAARIEKTWKDAAEREKANRTIFAQRSLKPADVMVEWRNTIDVLGEPSETARFFERALRRFGVPFVKEDGGYRLASRQLPEAILSRVADEELGEKIRLRTEGGSRDHLHRSHPLVGALSELLAEKALDPQSEAQDRGVLARVGVWSTSQVSKPTLVVLTRVRHSLTMTSLAGGQRILLAEETDALAFESSKDAPTRVGNDAAALIDCTIAHETDAAAKTRVAAASLKRAEALRSAIEARATERAKALEADHMRVRGAAKAAGTVRVAPVTPVDIVGVYTLLPALD